MKKYTFVFLTLIICACLSCSKDLSQTPDPIVEPSIDRLAIQKIVRRQLLNGQITVDSLGYMYDAQGHLSSIINLKSGATLRKFLYSGDNLTDFIDYTFDAVPVKNPIKILDGGNTIVYDYTRPHPNGGIDTSILTYKWSGDQLLEFRSYLHPSFMPNATDLKYVYSYDAGGNVSELTLVHYNGSSQWFNKNMEYDQKKNYFKTISRQEYILGEFHISYATRSTNNLIKTDRPPGYIQEQIWTYNADGYPLNMQFKGQNFIALEFTYNK